MQRTTTTRNQIIDRNDAVIRSLIERVYSKGELSRIDGIVTPDFTGESTDSPHIHLGPNGLRSHVLRLRTTLYGLTMKIDELHVRDDTFAVYWTARGTQERRFQGVDPTITIGQAGEEPHGNHVAISGETSGTIRDGRIHESWMVWNAADRAQQFETTTEDAEPTSSAAGRPLSSSVPLGDLPVPLVGPRTGGR